MKLKKLIKKMPKDTPLEVSCDNRSMVTNVYALSDLPYYKPFSNRKVTSIGVTPGGLISITLKGVKA